MRVKEEYGTYAWYEFKNIVYVINEDSGYGKGNREYASDVFSMLMEDGEYRLDVYNALNGSEYKDPALVEVISLEAGVSLSVRNDASFLIGGDANFYEHQSTYSPNMPLRFLIYFSHYLKAWIVHEKGDIFSRKMVKIPTPHFVVFYNGSEKRPEVEEMRLSAAFTQSAREGNEPDLEVKCIVYNINAGKNGELKRKSKVLFGYMHFVDKVRNYLRNGKGLAKAVDLAIDECIDEDVLKKFFENRKDEVRKVMDWDWMMERHIRSMKEEEREEGRQEGRQEGIRHLIMQIQKKISKGKALPEIADDLEMEESAISEIYDLIMKTGVDCSAEEIMKRISSEKALLLLK